jgi:hypothetical protein
VLVALLLQPALFFLKKRGKTSAFKKASSLDTNWDYH